MSCIAARSVEPAGRGWRPPAGPLALLVGGGAARVMGIACGGAALATGGQLRSGKAFTLREIDAMNRRGEVLNAAAIGLDIADGAALTVGAAWTIADWSRHRRSERAPLRVAWHRPESARISPVGRQASPSFPVEKSS